MLRPKPTAPASSSAPAPPATSNAARTVRAWSLSATAIPTIASSCRPSCPVTGAARSRTGAWTPGTAARSTVIGPRAAASQRGGIEEGSRQGDREVEDPTAVQHLGEALALGIRTAPTVAQSGVGLTDQRPHRVDLGAQPAVDRVIELAGEADVEEDPGRAEDEAHRGQESQRQLDADRQVGEALLHDGGSFRGPAGTPRRGSSAASRCPKAGRSSRAAGGRRRRRRWSGSHSRRPRRARAASAG